MLWPLGKLAQRIATSRRESFLTGKREVWRAPVPVIVVGNITAGGTGKTPFVIFLVHWLRSRGFNPGVVSRGYGGKATRYPMLVTSSSSPAEAGDEAPLLANRSGAPVVIDPDRVAAAKSLLADHECDVIVSDDGLQHYALGRDIEIVMIDGERGLGNGLPIPAGPMREPRSRLDSVDMLVAVGGSPAGLAGIDECHVASVIPCSFTHLVTGEELAPDAFVKRYPRVQAVAGIGNPARFLTTLTELGLVAGLRQFPDHHDFVAADLDVPSGDVIVMTEKDATKVRALLDNGQLPHDRAYFSLQVELAVPVTLERELASVLEGHGVTIGEPA
ncbi:MAG: tetraacyldisaccharide 4'-kinase [Pseudomonadaceae bacterium]|nr:tetraacyldisaccharide 4'-kinase [Pseudomonadaceae bacterium]